MSRRKRPKGWARPKPMSNSLCTQRLLKTVEHLAPTCAHHPLWTMNLGIIFYTAKWSPPKQRTTMLSTKLQLRHSRYWTTDSALQHLGGFLSSSAVQINKRPIQQQIFTRKMFWEEKWLLLCSWTFLTSGTGTELWLWSTGSSNCTSYGSMLKGNHTDTGD